MMTPTSSHYIVTDIQQAENEKKARQAPAEQAIEVMGKLLQNADSFVRELESNDMLGSAIVRSCQDLAGLVGNLAQELENQSQDEKRRLAQACLEDANAQQQQQQQQQQRQSGNTITSSHDTHQDVDLATMSEQDIMNALSIAQTLLRDIETSLRSISGDEADEIADVALTVAHLMILSLKDVHSTLTPEQFMSPSNKYDLKASDRIEMLDDEYDDEKKDDKSNGAASSRSSRSKVDGKDRMRALWPPLGPAVVSAAQWGKEEAANKSLLAVALGLTLWPAAIVTAMLGAPLVLLDGVLQDMYSSGGPLVDTIERGAAHVYHVSRLVVLCSGLMVRQSVRVVKRQVERHGGVEMIANDVGHAVLDRVTHPIQTIHMTWNGICVGAGALREGINFVQETMERHREQQKAEIIL